MCLSTVIEVYKKPKKKEIILWKGFLWDGQLRFVCHGLNGTTVVPLNQWIKAQGDKIHSTYSKEYPAGFHVAVNKKGARVWGEIILKIKARNIVAKGRQGRFICYIAKEIYVEYPSKEKKNG